MSVVGYTIGSNSSTLSICMPFIMCLGNLPWKGQIIFLSPWLWTCQYDLLRPIEQVEEILCLRRPHLFPLGLLSLWEGHGCLAHWSKEYGRYCSLRLSHPSPPSGNRGAQKTQSRPDKPQTWKWTHWDPQSLPAHVQIAIVCHQTLMVVFYVALSNIIKE